MQKRLLSQTQCAALMAYALQSRKVPMRCFPAVIISKDTIAIWLASGGLSPELKTADNLEMISGGWLSWLACKPPKSSCMVDRRPYEES